MISLINAIYNFLWGDLVQIPLPGGSTLGNIAMAQVSMNTVDIGLPQLAMHSAYETSGVKDTGYLIEASKEFYSCHIKAAGDGVFEIV